MLEHWHDFFLAELGASAALAGLVFVGISINLRDILSYASVIDRALGTVLELLMVLMIASLFLIPDQSLASLGTEVTVLSLIGAGGLGYIQWRNYKTVLSEYRRIAVLGNVMIVSVPATFLVGGVALLAGGGWGIGVAAFGILLAFCVAIYSAWVLLIEILR